MIRDRGRIKWTSLMLPEHVKMLRDWAKEDEWEVKKELDEQKLEWMDEILDRAVSLHTPVHIRYYKNHNYEEVTGRILKLDPLEKFIKIKSLEGEIYSICLGQIENIELV